MQAVLNKIENNAENLIKLLIEADNVTKNEIENKIVKMGENIVHELVLELKNLKGLSRGIAAMSLIRIGECAVPFLKQEAIKDSSFSWVADYLISEIECRG